MSFEACARSVERGDPERFLATMSASVPVRKILFPLYAFNVEVSRAPWVTEEPMIAEMRLQWWRDALEEIATGQTVRAHEVTTPLAQVLDADAARALDPLVAARRWDIYKDAFEDTGHFEEYVNNTSGVLLGQAARLVAKHLSVPDGDFGRDGLVKNAERFGFAMGQANFLRAIPDLEARGRVPLVDGTPEAVRKIGYGIRHDLQNVRGDLMQSAGALPPVLADVFRVGWQAMPTARRVIKDPRAVAAGTLDSSPLAARLRLLWLSARQTF